MTSPATRAEVAATACGDLFRGSGRILAGPIGVIPSIGARLAKLTHSPQLLLSDGEATIFADVPPVGEPFERVQAPFPYRDLFELIARGGRHVVMGAAQIDRHGNQNLSAIGDRDRPIRQLLGARAAATNTLSHATSYWIARHSPRVFVEHVDVVTGVGPARARAAGADRLQDLRRIVTDLGVLGFDGPGGTVSLISRHPGVSVDDIVRATGFALHIAGDVPETRTPDESELILIRERIDPHRLRDREVPTS
ncbi:CoA-transferase subunit beta [Microbacterium sp. YJN-G]|uniref:CoA-transferase subunit beta n=1 Tax=Microbacterium sp. YJN-G TaxID=2763257 RepID=UPI001D0C6949|nr:CoA-transferase [Microbacterium sp. YJN-G]